MGRVELKLTSPLPIADVSQAALLLCGGPAASLSSPGTGKEAPWGGTLATQCGAISADRAGTAKGPRDYASYIQIDGSVGMGMRKIRVAWAAALAVSAPACVALKPSSQEGITPGRGVLIGNVSPFLGCYHI